MHRMLQQLKASGIVVRESGGSYFNAGWRLYRIAQDALLNNTLNGARRSVLQQLVATVGEAAYLTACLGSEVICIDSVETNKPLQFRFEPGLRLPLHCSASGKLFLSQMSPLQQRRLLEHCQLDTLAPKARMTHESAVACLPALHQASQALALIDLDTQ